MKTFLSISVFLFFGIVCANAQVSLRITQPESNSHVSQPNNTIEITASPGIPVGQCIVIFVQDPNGNWWPYTNVNPINSQRTKWRVLKVQYGQTPPTDNGLPFKIQAIAVSESLKDNDFNIPFNSDGGSYSKNNFKKINGIRSLEVTVIRN
jgi:hypothetical protein